MTDTPSLTEALRRLIEETSAAEQHLADRARARAAGEAALGGLFGAPAEPAPAAPGPASAEPPSPAEEPQEPGEEPIDWSAVDAAVAAREAASTTDPDPAPTAVSSEPATDAALSALLNPEETA